jgi:hypothetical protein
VIEKVLNKEKARVYLTKKELATSAALMKTLNVYVGDSQIKNITKDD